MTQTITLCTLPSRLPSSAAPNLAATSRLKRYGRGAVYTNKHSSGIIATKFKGLR